MILLLFICLLNSVFNNSLYLSLCNANGFVLSTSLAFSSWTNNGIFGYYIFCVCEHPSHVGKDSIKLYMHVHSTSFCTHASHACTGPNSSSSSIFVPKSSAVKRNFNFFGTWQYADPFALQSIKLLCYTGFCHSVLLITSTTIPVFSLNIN